MYTSILRFGHTTHFSMQILWKFKHYLNIVISSQNIPWHFIKYLMSPFSISIIIESIVNILPNIIFILMISIIKVIVYYSSLFNLRRFLMMTHKGHNIAYCSIIVNKYIHEQHFFEFKTQHLFVVVEGFPSNMKNTTFKLKSHKTKCSSILS